MRNQNFFNELFLGCGSLPMWVGMGLKNTWVIPRHLWNHNKGWIKAWLKLNPSEGLKWTADVLPFQIIWAATKQPSAEINGVTVMPCLDFLSTMQPDFLLRPGGDQQHPGSHKIKRSLDATCCASWMPCPFSVRPAIYLSFICHFCIVGKASLERFISYPLLIYFHVFMKHQISE